MTGPAFAGFYWRYCEGALTKQEIKLTRRESFGRTTLIVASAMVLSGMLAQHAAGAAGPVCDLRNARSGKKFGDLSTLKNPPMPWEATLYLF